MMELGNMMFGNSRGEFSVPRGSGWECHVKRLFQAIGCENGYGEEFGNEIFEVHPYYWGDCTCGFEERDWQWSENNKCLPKCFYARYHVEEARVENLINDWSKRSRHMEQWSKDNGYVDAPHGMAVYCDCGINATYQEWRKINDHDCACPIVVPNFRFKPSGFELKWYKYPLRDSYMNQDATLEQFEKMVDMCVGSVTCQGS